MIARWCRRLSLAAACLMAGAASGAGAPAPAFEMQDSAPLTLAALTAYALQHHPATTQAWASVAASMADADAARALLLPVVGVDVPLSFERGAAAPAGDGSGGGSSTRSLAPSVSLSWVLFDFGARQAGVDAARWRALAEQLSSDRALQSVASAVEQSYFALLGARQLAQALELGTQAAQASLDVVQARRTSGLATVAESSQAEAALAEARLKLLQAQAQARSAAGSLAVSIGVPVNTPLEIADDAESGVLPSAGRIDELLAAARVSRADLAALDALVHQGEAQVAQARAQGRPSLGVAAQAGRRWEIPSSGSSGRDTLKVALTLNIPIFDGGLVRAQTQAARARVQVLQAQRDQQAQSVELEVWQSFQATDSAATVIASADALLRSATTAEEAARERYRAGVGLLWELLTAQSSAAQARVSVVQARYGARLAFAQLGHALGANRTLLSP